MPAFVDSHAHLADPAFADDVTDVIVRARANGAKGIVCIGESLASADRAGELARLHPGFLWYTVGVHPHDASSFDSSSDLPRISEHLGAGAVAIGECGLDYHYDNSPREQQRAAFAAQLQLAAESRVPVVVHTREAIDDTLAMVADAAVAGVRGVLHCFTGPLALAERALDAGWFVSFAGVITFRKWDGDALIRAVPDDRILVESDAPYLTPVPHRGKRNEPAYVAYTLARIADARGVPVETMGALTTRNGARLFGLPITDDPI